METNFKIRTNDKHIIYGTLRSTKLQTLVIFVHGLTGHKNEHQFFNGARYFSKHGIDTFRFDLYSGEKDGRVMTDCGISTHVDDLNTVVKTFRKKYKTIFVVGHSLGGITVLAADAKPIDGIILWDASHNNDWGNMSDTAFDKKLNAYILNWGPQYLIGKKMNDEWINFPTPNVVAQEIDKPLCVIVAGKGELVKAGKEYFKLAKVKKSFSVIRGAGHTFDEDGAEEKLFEETWKFVKRFK